MNFEPDHIYHIYNQGNNRQKIYFKRENFIYFLNKIRKHILPFCDILAWCLMPNHFHFMVYVNKVEIELVKNSPGATPSCTRTQTRTQTLNKSIGIMLASYTRAINNQENWSGSLFRNETKAINLTKIDGITPSWYNSQGITILNADIPHYQYPSICFNYIHNNPVVAGLVKKREDWEFSSYRDIVGLRKGNLVNKDKIKELGLL